MQDLFQRLRPCGRILNLSADGWTVWDCSPIYDDDHCVHVFATRWRALDAPDQKWFLASQIVHAVADEATGPYEIRDVVIDRDGGSEGWDASAVINAKIYRAKGKYCLLYTGCMQQRHDTQAIGMMVADSLNGPWERAADGPLIASAADRSGFDGYLCNNPAMVIAPDGKVRIYYKGRAVAASENDRCIPGDMGIGVAMADELGGPYSKQAGNPVVTMDRNVEDPYVWHDGNVYWMLLSEIGTRHPAGILLTSDDVLSWSEPMPAYPAPKEFLGCNQRLEEPNLLFDGDRPTHLFNVLGACPEDDAYSGFVFAID